MQHINLKPDSATKKRSSTNRKVPAPRRSAWVFLVGGITILLLYLGIAPRLRQSRMLHQEVSTVRDTLPLVAVQTLKWSNDNSAITLPSNIQAIDQTTLNARTSGYLSKRFVDIGSRVTKGEVLAVIESPEVDQQVNQSAADVAKSRAGVGQAVADMSRMRAAISTSKSERSRSASTVMQAQADLAHLRARALQANEGVQVARAKVKEAEQRLAGARADLARARVGEAMAKKTFDRWHQLEQAQAVSGQEADEKEADYEANVSRVEGAAAAVSSAVADVEASKESVSSAKADVQAANADVESGRQRVMAARAAVEASQSNIQAAQSNLEASRSAAEAARAVMLSTVAGLRRASTFKSFEQIVAPFSGVITARNVDVGDMINPSTGAGGGSDPNNAVSKGGLFGLARTDALRAVVNVPEDEMNSIWEQQTAEVSVREIPKRTFSGTVFHVSGALDAATRTLAVEVRIPNRDGVLKPGMYGQIRFMGVKARKTLQIPANALIFDTNGTRVATVSPANALHFVQVTVAKDLGDTIEIASGLSGNERIVTNPDDSLSEGEKVAVHMEQK